MVRTACWLALVVLAGCVELWQPPSACGGGCEAEAEARRLSRGHHEPSLRSRLRACEWGDPEACEAALRYLEITRAQRARVQAVLGRDCGETGGASCLVLAERARPFDGALAARACDHGVVRACERLAERPDVAPPGDWWARTCFTHGGEHACGKAARAAYDRRDRDRAIAVAEHGCAAHHADACAVLGALAVGRTP